MAVILAPWRQKPPGARRTSATPSMEPSRGGLGGWFFGGGGGGARWVGGFWGLSEWLFGRMSEWILWGWVIM